MLGSKYLVDSLVDTAYFADTAGFMDTAKLADSANLRTQSRIRKGGSTKSDRFWTFEGSLESHLCQDDVHLP